MKVRECGIRLVYEQDVEEFMETLVQCMLGSPEACHDCFYQNLSHQVDNRKAFGCSTSLQRYCTWIECKRFVCAFVWIKDLLFVVDMAKWVRIFWPNSKNTRLGSNFFDPKQKRVDPWSDLCFLWVNLTRPVTWPEPEPFFFKLFF